MKIKLADSYYIDMRVAGDGQLAANTIELLYIDTAPDAVVDSEASFGGGVIIGSTP